MAAHGRYTAGSGALPLPKVSFAHKWTAKLLGATMWFWIFYRVREDFPVLLGWRKPWEHGSHGTHENHEVHETSESH